MLASTLQRSLRKLNKRVRIYCGNDDSKPAGIFIVDKGEIRELMGVDKNYVHEWPTYNQYGKMIKGGWHRVVAGLVGLKLIDRKKSYQYFGYWDNHREPFQKFDEQPIDKAIKEIEARRIAGKRVEDPLRPGEYINPMVFRTDDVVDVGRMIAKESTARPVPPSKGNRP